MSVQFHEMGPIITMRFGDTVTDQDMVQAGLQIIGLLAKKRPFTLISDMSLAAPTPKQGKVLSDLMVTRRDDFRKYLKGNCIVCTNMLVRTAIRASMLATTVPFPAHLEATVFLAERWCKGQLAAVPAQEPPAARV